MANQQLNRNYEKKIYFAAQFGNNARISSRLTNLGDKGISA